MDLYAVARELWRRRVPQIVGAYFGVGLALLPFIDFLNTRYGLPSRLFEAALIAYVAMIPSVFLLAYNHGAPGRDPWRRTERLGVPVNLALTGVAALWVLFSGPTVEAMTETVVVTDEEGQEAIHLVPKTEFRKKLALYTWANDSGDAALDWLRYGFPLMLERDLRQNRFLEVRTPLSGSLLPNLARAGYEDGLDVPIPLQQEQAKASLLPFFVNGSFGGEAGRLTARLELYESDTARRIGQHTVEGEDPAAMIDELTPRLKAGLGVEDIESLDRDLPVSEHLSSSRDAVAAWAEALVSRKVDNDLEAASEHLSRAVELDPTFAVAHLETAIALAQKGRSQEAIEAIREVKKHDYRLTEQEGFVIRCRENLLKGQVDKAITVATMWSELYPDDLAALETLALYHTVANRVDEAIGALERILELDPQRDETLKDLGEAYVARRQYEEALGAFRRYAERHTEDVDIQVSIGRVERMQGNLEAARTSLEQAALLASGPAPALALLGLDLAEGDFEAARDQIAEARSQVSLPQDEAQVLSAELGLCAWRGQIRCALDLVPRIQEVMAQYENPVMIKIVEVNRMGIYSVGGRLEEGMRRLREIGKDLQPPLDRIVDLGYLLLYLATEDADNLATSIAKAEEFLEIFPDPGTRSLIVMARGQLAELRDDPAAAAALYREALEDLDRGSTVNASIEFRAVFLIGRARASIDGGDLATAEESLAEVLRSTPAHPEALVQLARLEEARGDREAASRHVDRALEIWAEADPGYSPVTEAMELKDSLD